MMDRYAPECGPKMNETNPEGCAELRNYTGIAFRSCNSALRGEGGKDVDGWPVQDWVKKSIGKIDEMFDAAKPVKETITVRRGLNAEVIDKLQPGDTFKDKGFVSTTIAPSLGEANILAKNAVMNIKVPKGTKGIYIAGMSIHPDEKEFLLPRGSEFVVDSISTEPASGMVQYNVSLVRQ